MGIYERSYLTLTVEEEGEYARIKKLLEVHPFKRKEKVVYSKALRHHISLFPDFYLDPVFLREDDKRLMLDIEKIKRVLKKKDCNERMILNAVRDKRLHWMIASILMVRHFGFGHHAAYIFPEFRIGTLYTADFLILGKGSGGWGYIFVELEAPSGRLSTKGGDFSEIIRGGLRQINNWNNELMRNWQCVRTELQKHIKPGDHVPGEFMDFDNSRINFAVVAGRRSEYNDALYRKARDLVVNRIHVMHFDHILAYSKGLIGRITY